MLEAKKYQAFYTKSTPLVDYMVSKLSLKIGDKIFEPCGGDGVFVEAILQENENSFVDIYELNSNSIEILRNKFSKYPQIRIKECDTLLDNELLFHSDFGGLYDKIIANPPYGAWQDYSKRSKIKKLYANLYVNETYGLFLYRCIKLLKDGGILTFIIPDTYLNLHMHKALRKYFLTETKIKELALFPSSFFPGVNFGYANLSIITLQKLANKFECLNNQFKILTNFPNVNHFSNINEDKLSLYSFTQDEILSNPDHAFLISSNTSITKLINESDLKIGDISSCVTGFYSGNDKLYLRPLNDNVKNSKKYQVVDDSTINFEYLSHENILEGIRDNKCFVPIVKGGNTKYLKPNSWYMNWSEDAVKKYKSEKKARYQNPKFYFKFGIGVPMISSSTITASLIENKLFDQSIVGIFPKDETLTYYLLAFFNSPTCNKIIRTINPSANNPSNYIKKIPYIPPSQDQDEIINKKIQSILDQLRKFNTYDLSDQDEINQIIEADLQFPSSSCISKNQNSVAFSRY